MLVIWGNGDSEESERERERVVGKGQWIESDQVIVIIGMYIFMFSKYIWGSV